MPRNIYVGKGVTDLSTLSTVNGDTFIFGEGTQAITAGLTLSAVASGIIIEVRPSFAGTIGGGSAGPLVLDGPTVKNRAGGGSMTLQIGGGATPTIESIGPHDLFIQGGGTVSVLSVNNRTTNVTGDVTVTTLRQSGGDAHLRYRSVDTTDVWVSDGARLVCGRGVSGTARLNGTLIVRREDSLASASQPIWAGATIEQGGGLFEFHGNASTGAITAHNMVGGKADYSKVMEDLTITATTLSRQSRSLSKFTSPYATVTANITQFGGDTDTDPGQDS